jgi:hypothetical protein
VFCCARSILVSRFFIYSGQRFTTVQGYAGGVGHRERFSVDVLPVAICVIGLGTLAGAAGARQASTVKLSAG